VEDQQFCQSLFQIIFQRQGFLPAVLFSTQRCSPLSNYRIVLISIVLYFYFFIVSIATIKGLKSKEFCRKQNFLAIIPDYTILKVAKREG
jgi:hypothetical protein